MEEQIPTPQSSACLPSTTLPLEAPTILIDSRESSAKYVSILNSQDLFEISLKRLEVGDICIEDLIVERKTAEDFWRSLEDGRLFRQLLLMKRLYRRRLLLIEGPISPQTNRERAAYEGVTARITATLQIPILFSISGADTARSLQRIAMQLYGFTTPQITRCIGANKAQSFHELYILIGIPGVGYTRAKGLIAHFGSLQKIFAATTAELQQAPGIGEFLARQLEDLFRRR